MSGLTFDWDDVNFDHPKVQNALKHLCQIFDNKVWYRISSSGSGLHIIIAELTYDSLFGTGFGDTFSFRADDIPANWAKPTSTASSLTSR